MASGKPATTLDFLNLATEFFRSRGVENPRLNAELLLCGVLELRRIDLYVQFDRPLSSNEVDRYREFLRRRGSGEPVQYILGKTEFFGREFTVSSAVLIPRPETEVLVEEALKRIHKVEQPHLLDIGTGSGVIAVTIAAERDDARVVATDISGDALAIARQNAAKLGVADRIEFRQGSMYGALSPDDAPFDAIVANPPYIRDDERETLQTEVVDHEPETALFAGPDGLNVIRPLIHSASEYLTPRGFCALEIGNGQADAICALWVKTAPKWAVSVAKDLAGIDRIVIAERINED